MSPAAITSVPLTVPFLGKLTTMPPGQCASVPGLSVQPQTPTVEAPTMSTSSSVPAFEVTRIRLVPRSIFPAARTHFSSAVSGTMRSSASGCSFDILRILAPAFRISGVSTACISPSTVQSTTKPACCNAVTTGASRWIATLAPVERIGTHPQQGKLGQVDVERARLRLRKNRSGVAGLDRAALENLAERVDPFRFDAIRQHALSPLQPLHQTSGNPRSRYDLNPCNR